MKTTMLRDDGNGCVLVGLDEGDEYDTCVVMQRLTDGRLRMIDINQHARALEAVRGDDGVWRVDA